MTFKQIFNHELNLYKNNEFVLITYIPDCIIEFDELGNEIDNSREEYTEGKYFVKENKIYFSVYRGTKFIDTEYYIFPLNDRTYLIETDSLYINTIKQQIKYFGNEFPKNLKKSRDVMMFAFYESDSILIIDEQSKKEVYKIFQ